MPLLHRYLGNPVLTGIGRLLFGSPVGDFHCGLRAFSKEAYAGMELQSGGMEFASEMVVRATLLKMRITEVPTTLRPDGRSRAPHLRTWRDGWRHLRFLLWYSPRWLFLYPGVITMCVGLLATLWLLAGPRHVHGVVFDIHTLMFAAMMVLVGFLGRFQGGGPESDGAGRQDGTHGHRGAARQDGRPETGKDRQDQECLFFAITLICCRHMPNLLELVELYSSCD